MIDYRYVIVGGGVAAGHAARAFVEAGLEKGELAIVSSESVAPYDRPPLSKSYLLGKKTENDIVINTPSFYDDHHICLHLKARVVDIDTDASVIELDSGEMIHYEKMLAATGSSVRKFPRQITNGGQIHYLRYLPDSIAIREAAVWAQSPLIIGGGYIGLEVAAGLCQLGCDARLIYEGNQILPRLFTDKMHHFFARYYEEQGVRLIGECNVVRFSREGALTRVHLDSGGSFISDFVVAGIGVAPALELFEATEVEVDKGIVVNEYLQSSVANIYAAGDVTEYVDLVFGKRRRIEHWQNAVDQGRWAAQNMVGEPRWYEGIPYFFSDMFDLSWEFWGDPTDVDDVVYVGDIDEGSFSVWWLRDDVVRAAFVLDRPEDERELAMACVREQRMAPSMIFSLATPD